MEPQELLLLVGVQNGAVTLEGNLEVSFYIIRQTPDDPAVMFLGIYPKDVEIYVHTKTCTQMFVAALFTFAKTWKQPRRPSVGDWINRL